VPVAQQHLPTAEVGKDGVQQPGALDQSLFERAPLVRAD
jgi:hypothetical protein